MVAPPNTRGLRFEDEASAANLWARRLEARGVRAIVLLIHQGGAQHPPEGQPDPNGCANFSGEITPILARLSPAIQVVVSAHTHMFYTCRIDGRLVTSAGSFGRLITRVDLRIDRATDRISSATATNEIVTRDVRKNPAQTQLLARYQARSDPLANRVVGAIAATISKTPNRAGESALGDTIADAQLAATSAADKGGAIVAFMNQGGIRADLVANGAPGRPADVTYRDLYAVQPFGNVLTVVTMTGDEIKRLLESQFDNPSVDGRTVLQVSSGFTYRYTATAEPGHHVDAGSIAINGRAVAPADRIRVEASDFLIAGGEGRTVFRDATSRVAGPPDIDALVAYFKTHSPVAPPQPNRIVRVDE